MPYASPFFHALRLVLFGAPGFLQHRLHSIRNAKLVIEKYVLPTKVEQTSTLSKLLNKRKYVSDENDDDVSIATIGESDSSVSSSDDDDDHGEDR